jgi:hypothetical protein
MRAFGIAAISIAGIFWIVYRVLVEFENHSYASRFFSDLVAYDKILASRKWHSEVFGCTYAIVSLKEGASNSPPGTWSGNEAWSKTPVLLAPHTNHDGPTNTVSVCVAKGVFSSDVAARLKKSVSEPGSHYKAFEGTISIYSEPQRIAAFVRYGD